MGFEVRPAARKRVLARVSVIGPSGGGKTYSSIKFARGLAGPDGSIIVVDTEDSADMYEGLAGGFGVVSLPAPYTIERYIDAIDAAEKGFGDVPLDRRALVVDQVSFAWAGEGGLLEWVDSQQTSRGGKEGFAAWKKGTPLQNRFIQRLLAVRAHLIVTMRQKVEWVVEKNEKGFTEPRKVGLAPIQRPGTEYEFQIEFQLDQESHKARVTKDRTALFDGQVFVPDVAHGAKLREFLLAGKGELLEPSPPPPPAAAKITASQLQGLIVMAKSAGLDKGAFLDLVMSQAGHRVPGNLTEAELASLTSALDGLKALNGQ